LDQESSYQVSDRVMDIPYDKTARTPTELRFVGVVHSTDTVRQAPATYCGGLPDKVLFPITRDATVSLIASQQANLDSIIRRP
jgi:hypothetical protein